MTRNPRRAYDAEGREIEPMSLANMREHGVRSVEATCEACKHEAAISVDNLPGDIYVPDVALRLRCSACGSKQITTRPHWTRHPAYGRGGYGSQSGIISLKLAPGVFGIVLAAPSALESAQSA